MQLPADVREYIDQRLSQIPGEQLRQACAELSLHYRGRRPTASLRIAPEARVAAYLLMRMPATYAAAQAVLSEVKCRLQESRIESCLDLGAGPGAASLAARDVFPSLNAVAMVESSPEMREAARCLIPDARFPATNLGTCESFPEHDLVVAAYVLGELPERLRQAVLARAWRAARTALVLIEPGSPAGFEVIRQARAWLIESGAHIAAPCPAEEECPMQNPDWCHFAARLERSSLLRRMKEARLSYEDEKLSYVAGCRVEVNRAPARIVRRPEYTPGLVKLALCDGKRIRQEAISRRSPEFREARKAKWGGPWPPQPD